MICHSRPMVKDGMATFYFSCVQKSCEPANADVHPHVLPKGVRVRVKNKGSQKHKRGRKRPKYQSPQKEHPETDQDLPQPEIHANHVKAQNAACRRRNSAFRRKTNTYAKTKEGLQRTLNTHQLIHNFIRPHWTTGQVPAVALGIVENSFTFKDILTMQKAA